MPAVISNRLVLLTSVCLLAVCCDSLSAKPRKRTKAPKEQKAWIDGKGMCVFPFAAKKLPNTSQGFAAAIERGYRRAMTLPQDEPIVVARGGEYPIVDSLRIDVCDAVVNTEREGRKPSKRHSPIRVLDAAHLELLGRGMSVEKATVNVDLTATDAELLLTRDEQGKPLLMLGDASDGRMSAEMSRTDLERLLLIAARKGSRPYGVTVDRTRLKMTVEDGRTVQVHLKLFTRVGFIPAGLHFRARMEINDRLEGKLSGLSCTGDEILGPLISGLIQPFIEKYNGTTRPLMNFPKTEMRLRDVQIVADETIRVSAGFGS